VSLTFVAVEELVEVASIGHLTEPGQGAEPDEPLTEVRGLKPSEVRPWVALLTSQMIGALVLQIAGRLDFLDTNAPVLVRMMLSQCLPGAKRATVRAARKPKQAPLARRHPGSGSGLHYSTLPSV
jgi:hypothetical protein